jgi:Polyketide cyclase / dehydrase and lipid transport
MSSYHFITRWRVQATCEEVYRTLEDAEDLARWWPSVYLDVKVREKGQAGGVGKVVELFTKGWLPYTLKWKLRVAATDFPNGYALQALGDFVGQGVWTFRQVSPTICEATYDWNIRAEKPLLKLMTPLLRPIFSANHLWAMRKGEQSLKLELLRRAAGSKEASAEIPPPPPPTFPHNLWNNKIL